MTLGVIFFTSNIFAQQAFSELEPPSFHYAILEKYDAKSDEARKDLDSIRYPEEKFNDALLFTLIRPKYLSEAQVTYLKGHVNFPANSSERTRKELDFLLKLQKERTPAQVEEVLEVGRVGYWPEIDLLTSHPEYEKNLKDLFYEVNQVMGNQYNAHNSPETAKLLKGIMNDMRLMEFTIKYYLLRARPYQLEEKLEPLKTIASPSFASGHTLWAYIQAYTLSELVPQKKNEFLGLAYEIGLSREIMGVHYPSDEEAARKVAHEMIRLMWSNERFQEDLRKARLEWQSRT